MASNPAEILAQGQALVPNAGDQMLRQQMGRLQIQGAQLQMQAQAQQLKQAQTAFQRQQSFGHDMETFTSNPTPQGLASLFGRYPEFAKPIQDAHGALDEGRRKTDMTQIGSVAAMASRGDFKGAGDLMETRIAADRAAGQDTASDEAILEHFRSPDPAQQKIGVAMAAIGLGGAVGPEQAAAFLKANGLSDEPFTLSQGQVRYGSDGQPIASVAPKPDYLVIPEGGKAVPVGPGGPQAGGTIQGNPSAPTAVAPGTMSPKVVAVSSTLAAGGLPAPVVAGFLGNFHVEGGYDGAQGDGGSSSGIMQLHSPDRIANFERVIGKPVTQASPEEQAKFVLWEMQNPIAAGMTVKQRDAILGAKTGAQAAALIDQHYERSSGRDRKIRMSAATAFERDSAPAQAAPSAQAASGAQPGDPAGTIYGNPKPGAHVLTAAQATAQGLDPSKVYQQHPDGTVSAVGDAVASESMLGDPNKTGPEYFASLPRSVQPTVRAIIDGRFPITAKMTSPNVIKLFEAANRVDPTVDATTYQRRVATQRDFASSGKSGQALTSARTIINHLYNIAQESERIGGVGWTPVNAFSNWVKAKTSDPDLQGYMATLTPLSNELPKFLGGKAPTIHEITQTRDDFSPDKGPEARRKQIATTIELMQGRFDPIVQAYTQGMNRNADISDLISRVAGDPVAAARLRALQNYAAGGHLSDVGGSGGGHAPGLPHGAKPVLDAQGRPATYQGKPVYVLPNGKRVVPQ